MEPAERQSRPWEELQRLVGAEDIEEVEAYLASLPSSDATLAVSRLSEQDQSKLMTTLAPEEAATIIQHLPDVQVVELFDELAPETAAEIIEELPSDERADLVSEIAPAQAEAILSQMGATVAEDVRSLILFTDDVAGGLMVKEYLAYPQSLTVAQVLDDLRANAERYRRFDVQYAYVTDSTDKLVGVLRLRDLLLADSAQQIADVMIEQPLTVDEKTGLEKLRDFFDQHQFFGVPVIDQSNRLVGVVRRSAVEEAMADHYADDFRKAQGIIREELRTMPVLLRSRRRLSWLSVNILLNVVAASVIAFYQDTLAQVIALAVFLPIISDMSGCSGNQAVAVSMRELALGMVRPNELMRVWLKELAVGVINGVALGLLIATVAWLWQGTPGLGLVVGAAMALNTVIAVSIGGTLPLVIRRMNMDPALASGPILTTITDMCGFFLVLGMATAMLPRLTM